MARWLPLCWLVGVALLFPIVDTVGNFFVTEYLFVREYGEPLGVRLTWGFACSLQH